MELLAGFLLILLTGFYAGSETALYRANWVRINHWAKNRLAGARDALIALEKIGPTLIATIVGTNLASVFATILFQRYFVTHLGAGFTPLAVLLVVLLTLILGDYLPKTIAQSLPSRWLRTTALLLNLSRIGFAPASYLLARLLPRTRSTGINRDDFLKVIAQREQTFAGRPTTANMAARLFRFSQMTVGEIAIPIKQVKSVPADSDLNTVLALLNRYGYSRIPVYQGTSDNIIGVIVAKDLLEVVSPETGSEKRARVRPVHHLPENSRALDILRQMQQRGEHLSVVFNPSGNTLGIVTLEDLIEELVGEIRSED